MSYSNLNKITSGRTRSGLTEKGPVEIPVKMVHPNPDQPRKHFPAEQIEELAASIEEHGLLQPIVVVKKVDGTYMIVAGERRYRAHLYNGAATIKANIIDADDDKIMELALVENIQRDDLTDYELAVHIAKLWATGRYKLKQDLAAAISKPQSYLSKAFGALRLDPEITADLEEARRDVPLSVLEELGRVKDQAAQREAYTKYLDGEITRDDIKSFKEIKHEKPEKPTQKVRATTWTIAGNWRCSYGLSIEEIINVANTLGVKLPDGFDEDASGKHYKITIEEL